MRIWDAAHNLRITISATRVKMKKKVEKPKKTAQNSGHKSMPKACLEWPKTAKTACQQSNFLKDLSLEQSTKSAKMDFKKSLSRLCRGHT